jgi:selenocysteine lyase/cysteine desulfurase
MERTMMMNRRKVLGAISLPIGATMLSGIAFPRLSHALSVANELSATPGTPEEIARDNDFWFAVRGAFTPDNSLINLQSGGVSPSPRVVQEAMKRYLDYSNTVPTYTMWEVLEPQQETVRKRLAREWGVDADEVAIVRGSSEGLQIVQNGIDLQPGDEVLTTNQDYVRMIWTYHQRERREGIVLRQISIPVPAEDPAEIVRRFRDNITPRTKIIHMCHMINLSGQILPVREVADLAHSRGLPLIVDGAHSLAHIDFRIPDLGCDYFATSLHKWLFAPHGTGLLYVRRDRIKSLWALQAPPEELDSNIRKFEEIGTRPVANALAIGDALTFHQGLGSTRKQARLTYLRDYWMNRLGQQKAVRWNTSQKPGMACGIGNFDIPGTDLPTLNQWLFDKRGIVTHVTTHPEYTGIRVTPNVFTTLDELDRFCDAVEAGIREGIGARKNQRLD